MFWRFFSFVLCQALPALAAWSFVVPPYQLPATFMAALLGSYIWLLLDVLRGARLLEWLKAGDTADTPLGGGLWGEVFDRVRKLVRARDVAQRLAQTSGGMQQHHIGRMCGRRHDQSHQRDRETRGAHHAPGVDAFAKKSCLPSIL